MSTTIDDLFPSRFLKAADLKGQRRALTMAKITSEEIGKDKKHEPVVYFQKCSKGLVLNKTNAKRIAEVVGSKALVDWPGKSVVLYPKLVEFAGDLVEAIRVDAPSGNGVVADESASPPAEDVFGDDSALDNNNDDVPDFPVPETKPAEDKAPRKRKRSK